MAVTRFTIQVIRRYTSPNKLNSACNSIFKAIQWSTLPVARIPELQEERQKSGALQHPN